jgi:hypothetical protein
MQPWISLANVIGDLLVLAAAVTDLAAARARAQRDRPRRRRGTPAVKAITARYHAHHDTDGAHPQWRHHR